MSRQVIPHHELTTQLLGLGVSPGWVLLVHTSLSRVAPVEGGPRGLIAALRTAVGPGGTLVMPSMTDDDDHPFDPEKTACPGMGIVADSFWGLRGVLRSNSPHAFAAVGPNAARITAEHPLDVPHGLNSPAGRVYELDGQILLLGGQPTRYEYDDVDHCCQNFSLMDQWLETARRQRRGIVGHGEARLIRSRDVVEIALDRLRENETAFLHLPGVDIECDEARASLAVHPGT